MIEAIVEVWCSPLRQEDYSVKIIPLCAGDLFNVEDDIKDYINWDFYLNTFGGDYLEVKGLWKVVFKISVSHSTVWTYDGPDDYVDIGQEVLFKGQCDSWTEMKYTWLELNGKIEDYFRKPWKKHLGLYESEQAYTGTGSDYFDCVLGIGGFEQYGPIKGVKGLTDE